MTFLLPLLLTLMNAGPLSAAPSWDEILQVHGGREMWISDVHANSKDDWYVSGRWGVTRNGPSGIQRHETPGRAVLGLFADADGVFALGDDELILRFDGKDWIEEHVGPKPKRKGHGADIVYIGFRWDRDGGSVPVAVGPSLVLVRQRDHTWQVPAEPERQKLLELGQIGPSFTPPPRCAKAGWFWLGHNRGLFDCHDGRSFLFDEGRIIPKGRLPRECTKAFDGTAYGQGEVFATCGGTGKVWKTTGEGWRLFATFKGEEELAGLSITDGCVFVAGRQKLWRNCTSR